MARHQPLPNRFPTNYAGTMVRGLDLTGRVVGRMDKSFMATRPVGVMDGDVLVKWDNSTWEWVNPEFLITLKGDPLCTNQ